MKKFSLLISLTVLFSFFCLDMNATHFRYGTVSYEIISQTGSGVNKQTVVKFTFNQAWRAGIFGSNTPAIGSVINAATWSFGDGTSTTIALTVTALQVEPIASNNWFIGNYTVNHTYTGNTDVTAFFSSCCRISTLQGGNANDGYRNETVVTLSENFNDSPVSSLPAIVNVPIGLASYNLNLNAIDPNGDPLTYALSTTAQSQLNPNNTAIYNSVNAATGVVSLNTTGKVLGQLWALQFMITDSKGARVPIDFIVRIVGASTAPQFVVPSPVNNAVFKVLPNNPVAFTVKASDADVGDVVSLLGSGIPAGAVFTPPAAANPIMANFNWVPTNADLGAHVITFSATDNNGIQTLRTINIIVSLAPVFNVPPTPPLGVHNTILPGQNLTFTVKATDPDANDSCRITNAQGKSMGGTPIPLYAGATMNPVLPSPWGNMSQSVFSWTPTAAQWGHRHVFFTATDGFNDQTVHEVPILVNTPPIFRSNAPTTACVNQKYTYHIITEDVDTAYGDTVKLYAIGLPGWLTLVDSGNGRGSLCGTPGPGDVGATNFNIEAQDLHHHHNGTVQEIVNINVQAVCGQANPPCAIGNTFKVPKLPWYIRSKGTFDQYTYYHGLSRAMRVRANPVGVGPFTYKWTSSAGYTVKNSNKKQARLWYPTGPTWMIVEITDVGQACSVKDSIYIDWSDEMTCNPPGMIWYYQLCKNGTTDVCVQSWWNMIDSLNTGNYTFGHCGVPKRGEEIANSDELFINLFPNPNNGQYTYLISGLVGDSYNTVITDMKGAVVYEDVFTSKTSMSSREIDLKGLSPGTYFMRVTNSEYSKVTKVIIVK